MGSDLHGGRGQELKVGKGSQTHGERAAEVLQGDGEAPRERAGQPCTHRLRGFDEHFAPPKLELVAVHVDGLQQVEDTLFLVPSPRGPGGFGQNGIPVRTTGERRIRLTLDYPPEAPGAVGSQRSAHLCSRAEGWSPTVAKPHWA